MNKWVVVATLVLAAIFIAVIAKADYPNGFDKIKEVIDRDGAPLSIEGVIGVECVIPDTVNKGNENGKVILMAAEGDKGIGVAIAIVTEEKDPLMYVAIYHFTADHTTVVVNILTGEQDTIDPTICNDFITQWLKLYCAGKGTPI